jgi:hypothetical protein
METQKAARGNYAGKIWDRECNIESLLLNATQLENSLFSEKHVVSMRALSKELNNVVISQIGTKDKQGQILLKYIKENNHSKLKEYIARFNFDINSNKIIYNGESRFKPNILIMFAIEFKASTDIFRVLINNEINLNIYEGILEYLLYKDLENEYEIMKLFIENGCWDINKESLIYFKTCPATPLHYAIHIYNYRLIKFLLDNGADKNIESLYGVTPLNMIKKNAYITDDDLEKIKKYTFYKSDLRCREESIKLLEYMGES